jgi:hypothetical protein
MMTDFAYALCCFLVYFLFIIYEAIKDKSKDIKDLLNPLLFGVALSLAVAFST